MELLCPFYRVLTCFNLSGGPPWTAALSEVVQAMALMGLEDMDPEYGVALGRALANILTHLERIPGSAKGDPRGAKGPPGVALSPGRSALPPIPPLLHSAAISAI